MVDYLLHLSAFAADFFGGLDAAGPARAGFRHLDAVEISLLESAGNSSPDWSSIWVASDMSGIDRIRGCHFEGRVILSSFTNNVSIGHGCSLPSGLCCSNFSGTCVVGANCLIRHTSMIKNVVVGENASILNCGLVVSDLNCDFGNGREIVLGPETGGRNIKMFAGLGYGDLCRMVLARDDRLHKARMDAEAALVAELARGRPMSVIGNDCIVSCNSLLKNVLLGAHASVSGSVLDNCSVLSSKNSPVVVSESCTLTHVVICGRSSITRRCHVHNSIMFEASDISDGANVSNCVLGPDSSLSSAECLHSLVGPFIGIHHTSLVIACSWATGRGNVAYGAKVGANHTGRVSDQECLSGEGCFYGLGVQIKYPFHTLNAPYSIFAAGTSCLPQKITYPFSLISPLDETVTGSAEGGMSPALNIIRPGWVLYASPYTLLRTENKFRKRRKSSMYSTDHGVMRRWVVLLMQDARNRLRRLGEREDGVLNHIQTSRIYTESNDIGIGKNILKESDRQLGMAAYTSALRRYALEVILDSILLHMSSRAELEDYMRLMYARIMQVKGSRKAPREAVRDHSLFLEDLYSLYPSDKTKPSTPEGGDVLPFEILLDDILPCEVEVGGVYCSDWFVEMLNIYIAEMTGLVKQVQDCRNRDLQRGRRIIHDYEIVQGLVAYEDGNAGSYSSLTYAETDSILLDANRDLEKNKTHVNNIFSLLEIPVKLT